MPQKTLHLNCLHCLTKDNCPVCAYVSDIEDDDLDDYRPFITYEHGEAYSTIARGI